MSKVVDYYSEANHSGGYNVYLNLNKGQGFKPSSSGNLVSCKFYLTKYNSPTGSCYAKLYTHSGNFGTTGVPGTLLATSDALDVSTIGTTISLITFTFSGINQYALVADTEYFITFEYSGGNALRFLSVGRDNSSPTHSGNISIYISSWNANSTADFCFYVYVDSGGDIIETDSYSESNYNSSNALYPANSGMAQSFTVGTGGLLDSCKFYLRNNYSLTGNVYAKLYALTGTYGTTSKPTGSALATSDAIDASTIGSSFSLIEFNFSGLSRISLTYGEQYCISVEYSGGINGNYVNYGVDISAPTHQGNLASSSGSWSAASSSDSIFYVYIATSDYSVSLSDSILISKYPFGSYILELIDHIIFEEILTPLTRFKQALSDRIELIESYFDNLAERFWIATTDTLNLTEAFNTAKTFGAILSDALNLSENISKITRFTKSLISQISLVENLVVRKVFVQIFSDSISLVENLIFSPMKFGVIALDRLGLSEKFNWVGRFWIWVEKHTANWTYQNKSATPTWTNIAKNASNWIWQHKNK
jgi:hypothetical protein